MIYTVTDDFGTMHWTGAALRRGRIRHKKLVYENERE